MTVKRKQITVKERKQIYAKCNGHCGYCGCILPYEKMQVDHITSYITAKNKEIAEGKEIDINEFDNLLPSCGSCNRYKRELGLEGFREWMAEIVKRLRYNNVTFQIAGRYGMVKELKWDGKFYFEKFLGGD